MSGTVLAKTFSSIPDPRSAIRLVGTSKAWCLERAARVAATDVTTCLQGESGTGKEVIARFIHASSPRSPGPDDVHIVGRNASQTAPAKFLVFLVKDKGAPVLAPVE